MQKNTKDKMLRLGEDEIKEKGIAEEYFFSGGTEYLPQTITAKSKEEAEKEWLQIRKKVEQETQK